MKTELPSKLREGENEETVYIKSTKDLMQFFDFAKNFSSL